MSYSIKYSPTAIRDLDRIFDEVYQASLDINITKKYIDELLGNIETKKDFPESGIPLLVNDVFSGYRYVIFKSYIAFYYVEKDFVYVDRVLSGKSDYIKRLHL